MQPFTAHYDATLQHVLNATKHAHDKKNHATAIAHLKEAMASAENHAKHLEMTEGAAAAQQFKEELAPHIERVIKLLDHKGTKVDLGLKKGCAHQAMKSGELCKCCGYLMKSQSHEESIKADLVKSLREFAEPMSPEREFLAKSVQLRRAIELKKAKIYDFKSKGLIGDTGVEHYRPMLGATKNGYHVPDVNHEDYQKAYKLKGYQGPVNVRQAVQARDAGNIVQRAFPHYDKNDHLTASIYHKDAEKAAKDEWVRVKDAAEKKHYGKVRDITEGYYKISGGVDPKYHEHTNDLLRHLAHKETAHSKIAAAHAHAAKYMRSPKMEKSDLEKAKIIDFNSRKVLHDEPPTQSGGTGAVKIGNELRPTGTPKHADVAEARKILGAPMIKPGAPKVPTEPAVKTPEQKKEAHLNAAMHHATWWAGHQGQHDTMGDPSMYDMGAQQSEHEQYGHGGEFDEDAFLAYQQAEGSHIPAADKHLKLFRQHLKAAGGYKKVSEEGFGDRSTGKLLDAVNSAKIGEEHTHIDGSHISHYGPEGVHGLPGTAARHIASYAHESEKSHHPMDKELPEPKPRMPKKPLGKSDLEKAKIYSFETGKKVADLPANPTEIRPSVGREIDSNVPQIHGLVPPGRDAASNNLPLQIQRAERAIGFDYKGDLGSRMRGGTKHWKASDHRKVAAHSRKVAMSPGRDSGLAATGLAEADEHDFLAAEKEKTPKKTPKPRMPKKPLDKAAPSPMQIGLAQPPNPLKQALDAATPKIIKPKPLISKTAANPDEKEDAKLGEKVESLVEHHMMENLAAEKKEGHPLVQKAQTAPGVKSVFSAKIIKPSMVKEAGHAAMGIPGPKAPHATVKDVGITGAPQPAKTVVPPKPLSAAPVAGPKPVVTPSVAGGPKPKVKMAKSDPEQQSRLEPVALEDHLAAQKKKPSSSK